MIVVADKHSIRCSSVLLVTVGAGKILSIKLNPGQRVPVVEESQCCLNVRVIIRPFFIGVRIIHIGEFRVYQSIFRRVDEPVIQTALQFVLVIIEFYVYPVGRKVIKSYSSSPESKIAVSVMPVGAVVAKPEL